MLGLILSMTPLSLVSPLGLHCCLNLSRDSALTLESHLLFVPLVSSLFLSILPYQLKDCDVKHGAVSEIPNIDHRIISIEAVSSSEVEVYTGYIKGPLNGGGDVVTIVKEGPCWKWFGGSIGTWIS